MKKVSYLIGGALVVSAILIACHDPISSNMPSNSVEQENETVIDRNKNFVRIGRNNKWGFIDDETRTLAIDFQFEGIGHFSEYLSPAAIIQNGTKKWGYIDTLGQWIVTPRFDDAKDFSEGLAGVKVDGFWGFINHSGQFVIPPQFSDVYDYSEGLVGVFDKEKKFEYIDKVGNVAIKRSEIADGSSFSNGLARVWVNFEVGFIDKEGNYAIQPLYGNAQDYSDGIIAVKVGSFFKGKWGYIDKNNNMIINAQYDDARNFVNGFACVTLNDKYCIINKRGNIVSDRYDMIREYCDGLAPVSQNGKWGFVNRAGKLVIPLQYDEVVPYGFNNGHCWVICGNYMMKIDREGNILMQGSIN